MATIGGRPRRSSGLDKHREQTGTHQQGQTHRNFGGKRHREEQETRPRVERRRHCELPEEAYREEAEIEGYPDAPGSHRYVGGKWHHEEQDDRPRVKRRRHWGLPDVAHQEEAETEEYPDTHGSYRQVGGIQYHEEQEARPRVKRTRLWKLPAASYWEEEETEDHSDTPGSNVEDDVLSPATATNTPVVASTTPAQVARKATRLTLTEYTARTKQPSAAPHISTDKPVRGTPLDKFQTVYRGGAQECPSDSLDAFDVEVEVDTMPEPINVNLLSSTQVSRRPWFMNSIEEHPRPKPSLWIRRKNNKLGSANKLTNWTSHSGSTVLLDDVFRPATATITPIMTSDSALENNTPVLIPTKSEIYTLDNYMPLPTLNARTLENNILVPALSKTSTDTLEDNMMVPVPRKTFTHTLELEDYAHVPATTITPPVVIFNSPFRLLDLPRELRDDIYSYLTPGETFWIGRPPVVGEE